ncbi:hypothetical protein ACFLU6_14445 [Acidobacteriota bacterium]
MLYTLIGIAIAVLLFLWWRHTSVQRGAKGRNKRILRLLDPIGQKLANKQDVTPKQVETLAAKPHVRPMLYAVLKEFDRVDLFPQAHLTAESQAEACLAYWLLHPNEFNAVPKDMKLVEKILREVDGDQADFYVFRFKMGGEISSASDDWHLGLAGPLFKGDPPYSRSGAFSRAGDKYGEVNPSDLVDWYIGMLK